MLSELAPVAIFAYNRPDHLKRTIEFLLKNDLSKDSILYIFSDGCKSANDFSGVGEVREFCKTIVGFKDVFLVERSDNIGLSASIIGGVGYVLDRHEKIIVLEDDLEVSVDFLRYMNYQLLNYKNNSNVMHVSGYIYPVDNFENINEVFFMKMPMCWGWGTWRRAWNGFSKDLSIKNKFNKSDIRKFNFENSNFFWHQLMLNWCGSINTWFVFWYAHVYIKNGLSVYPSKSFVRNNGFDDSGENCVKTNDYDVELLEVASFYKNKFNVVESDYWYKKHVAYFRKIKNRNKFGIFKYIIKYYTKIALFLFFGKKM